MMEAHRGHHDVDNGVNGADLVEMNFIHELAVDACFGFGDAVKDLESCVPDGRLQRGLLQEVTDLCPGTTVIVVMIPMVMMVVGMIVRALDEETGAGDPAAHSALGSKGNLFG